MGRICESSSRTGKKVYTGLTETANGKIKGRQHKVLPLFLLLFPAPMAMCGKKQQQKNLKESGPSIPQK